MALSKKQRDFVDSVYTAARNAGMNHVQASVTAAQAAQETGYGKSAPGNNFFGIKAGKSWKGPVNRLTTTEEVNGKKVKTKANFRAYANPVESLKDRIAVMARAWPDFTKAQTFKDAFAALENGRYGKYATDSNYQPAVSNIIGKMDYWGGPPQTYGMANSLASLANVPTPTDAPRQGILSAPVSPVERSPLGTLENPTVAGGYITGKPESFMPDVQQPSSISQAVANNPESYTPAEAQMMQNASLSPPGLLGSFADPLAARMDPTAAQGVLGYGFATPAMTAPAPTPAPAMTPARNVSQMAVASVNPSPAAAPAPSAADFRAGLADWGVATDGTTFSRDALGREVTTTPSGHSTVALDNGLTAAMWGAPAQSQGIQSTIEAPKDFGLHMPSRDKLMGAAKTFGGGAAGGLLGGALLGPLGGLLGAALGRSVAQGKGLQGLLGNGITRTSFPSAPTMAGQRNSQATTDKIARTFGYSGATGGMDPTERGYAPGAHDSIDRGETVGLF